MTNIRYEYVLGKYLRFWMILPFYFFFWQEQHFVSFGRRKTRSLEVLRRSPSGWPKFQLDCLLFTQKQFKEFPSTGVHREKELVQLVRRLAAVASQRFTLCENTSHSVRIVQNF